MAIFNIAIPKLGYGSATTEVVEWKAKEGDWVNRGTIVLTIETEKISWDVETEISGYLHIIFEEKSQVPIGTIVGIVAETKEELKSLDKMRPQEQPVIVDKPGEAAQTPGRPSGEDTGKAEKRERIRITPVANKIAKEHGIDITKIAGTGPGGRIVKEDIRKAIEAGKKEEGPAVEVYQGKKLKSIIPLKGKRAAIAEHMHRSLSISAQVTVMGEIDMTEIIKIRKSLVEQTGVIGTKITYTGIFVFAIARLLRENPMVNSTVIANEIKLWDEINIGVAVALDQGLIVPVVKNADKKSLVEISKSIKTLTEKARKGKLIPEDVTGSTFTITNIGSLGGGYRFETVIINQPESAILGTGGITDRVVAREGQIVIRPIMTYYLTYDHRVLDGAVVAKFVAGMIKLFENPALLLA